jgi:hypothetical protein
MVLHKSQTRALELTAIPSHSRRALMTLALIPGPAPGEYFEARFAASDHDVAEALAALLDLARTPRAAMILAHTLWEELPQSNAADTATWERALARLPDYVTEDEMRTRWDALTPIHPGTHNALAALGSSR